METKLKHKKKINHYNWDRIRTQIADDRKFLQAFTNEEFITAEARRLNIEESYIEKALRECGFYNIDLNILNKVDFSVVEYEKEMKFVKF